MTSKLNVLANEPVLVSVLASILTWVAAKYAVKVDPQQASEAAGVVLLIAGGFARQLVRPTVKDQAPLTAEEAEKARALLDAYQPDQKTVPPRV